MTRRTLWKKAQMHKVALDIGRDIAAAFNVPAPVFYWAEEWRCERVKVWTHAGAAELSIRISPRFAHLYFRFDDPARALPFDDHMGRLNQDSGKWNDHATPDDYTRHGKPDPQWSLDAFRHCLLNDFEKVAQPNPPADEVAAWQAKEAARAAQWAEYMATLFTSN